MTLMPLVNFAARAAVGAVRFARNRLSSNVPQPHDSTLLPGQATIVDADGDRVGIYRDSAGELRAVRARCTHRDWELEFNAGSRTWNCPLHGARFAIDGTVIRGPATTALEAVCLPREIRSGGPPATHQTRVDTQ
ncbi:MAG: hypothetical protein EKK51_31300 [Mycolicibacterium sp.]|jgi:Rieske Fe-S protein|uniref:Rieske 2Fe-2S domain-containing protein n=2 Tax=Mycobacteriaceae TaxID=1762 RepID=UPI0009F4B375|nr:Rieske 2Fe-2S domain-containing protein [Mycobacterium sp. WUMAC-067]MCA2317148.1 Rieske 2Fe-2S domain-containing protein [Mycobacterium sp. WUMAC-025]RUP25957.1 MAG: hypothetical protein EKK51_31300 [Mycolicibacterium sp.]